MLEFVLRAHTAVLLVGLFWTGNPLLQIASKTLPRINVVVVVVVVQLCK